MRGGRIVRVKGGVESARRGVEGVEKVWKA